MLYSISQYFFADLSVSYIRTHWFPPMIQIFQNGPQKGLMYLVYLETLGSPLGCEKEICGFEQEFTVRVKDGTQMSTS